MEASRHDCLDEEEEGNEAELLPLADLLREASVDGGEQRRPQLGHGHVAARVRVSGAGKMRGGEREQGVVVLLIHQGSATGASWCVRDGGGGLGHYSHGALQGGETTAVLQVTPWLLFLFLFFHFI